MKQKCNVKLWLLALIGFLPIASAWAEGNVVSLCTPEGVVFDSYASFEAAYLDGAFYDPSSPNFCVYKLLDDINDPFVLDDPKFYEAPGPDAVGILVRNEGNYKFDVILSDNPELIEGKKLGVLATPWSEDADVTYYRVVTDAAFINRGGETKYYETFGDALDAASEEDVIVLLQDASPYLRHADLFLGGRTRRSIPDGSPMR